MSNTIITIVFFASIVIASLLVSFVPAATTLLALTATVSITSVIGLIANSDFSIKTLCA